MKSNTVPLIGLPVRMDAGTSRQYLSREYADAVAAAGGVPILLPLLDEPKLLRDVAERLDGIVLTGSDTDVDPATYGATKLPQCGPVQPSRDRTDFLLLEVALRREIPVLAICFGMQSLNVFLGGTLIQDIPSSLPEALPHSVPQSNGKPCHDIEIVVGSLLQELAGELRTGVNSTHHQAIQDTGRGLEVIARADDGVIESVVGNLENQWVLGVQWHPEKNYEHDAFSQKIFHCFLAECLARK